jgi:hypothetical protein
VLELGCGTQACQRLYVGDRHVEVRPVAEYLPGHRSATCRADDLMDCPPCELTG